MAALGTFGSVGGGELRSSEGYRELIKEAIRQTAGRGGVAIVAHAASHALAEREGVLRVFVTASPPARASRLARQLELDEHAAIKRVKESDDVRADYLRRFYDERDRPRLHRQRGKRGVAPRREGRTDRPRQGSRGTHPCRPTGTARRPVTTLLWLCSPESRFVTGLVVPVDGGFSAWSGI
jgi:Cytidylate kinase-like family